MLLSYSPVLRPGSGRLSFAEVSACVIAVRSQQKGKTDWGGIYVGSSEQMKALTVYFLDTEGEKRALAFACRYEAAFKLATVADVMKALQEAVVAPSSLDAVARTTVQDALDELVLVHVGLRGIEDMGKGADLNF
jgi:hypothetical protein